MAFDFAKLLADPTFQFGASLMSGARQPNSVANAFAASNAQADKVAALKQAQAVQQSQIAQNQMELQLAQRKFEMQQQFVKAHPEIFGGADGSPAGGVSPFGGGAQTSPVNSPQTFEPAPQVAPPMQAPSAAQPIALGGAPTALGNGRVTRALLDSLAQVESSGRAGIVNPASGAAGMYQFMPGTTAQIRKRNPSFDPFNADMARAEAQRMLINLTQKNGGSLEKALASYGGFVTKDPSAYIAKVMRGAGMTPGALQQVAQTQPQPQMDAQAPAAPGQVPLSQGSPIPVGGGMSNAGLDMIRAAAGAGVIGFPGAAQLMEYGKALAPQNVAAGSYQRDPATGAMQYIQDPMASARLKHEGQRIAMEQSKMNADAISNATKSAQEERKMAMDERRTNATVEKQTNDTAVKKEGDISGYQEVATSMDRLKDTVSALLKHPGLPANTGLTGMAKLYNVTQEGRDANALLDNVKNKLVIDTLMKMKAVSKNGSSGFGALSEKEGTRLETYISNLSQAQSLPAMKKALRDILTFADQSKSALGDRVKNTYGADALKIPTGAAGASGGKIVDFGSLK